MGWDDAILQVSWDDIGGLQDVKVKLKEAVELPFHSPEALMRLGVLPPRGQSLGGSACKRVSGGRDS